MWCNISTGSPSSRLKSEERLAQTEWPLQYPTTGFINCQPNVSCRSWYSWNMNLFHYKRCAVWDNRLQYIGTSTADFVPSEIHILAESIYQFSSLPACEFRDWAAHTQRHALSSITAPLYIKLKFCSTLPWDHKHNLNLRRRKKLLSVSLAVMGLIWTVMINAELRSPVGSARTYFGTVEAACYVPYLYNWWSWPLLDIYTIRNWT
jgi:hypothetical protein